MQARHSVVRSWMTAILLLVPVLLGGCGAKDRPVDTATTAAATGGVDLSPETLEALVAPIALYPDVVIGHVLLAATNPQEVLDAGNWLLEHADLAPAALDKQAADLGLSTSMRALLPFPETVDMMCREIDWTTDLGAAFNADQAAVLDAVQRMRKQAVEVGNLQTSEQLKVESTTSEGKPVVLISPPKPEVIYVPKYDPVAVYAPPPATVPPPTQTVVVEEKKSSSDALVVGLLCFTAGVLIADAAHDNYYGYPPHYGYGGIYYGGRPYYPPPPYMYRPPYGGGYYPAHGYHPPGNYNHNFNNNTIIINQGDNNYWNNDFGGGNSAGRAKSGSGKLESPITKANPNRPELNQLNQQGQERTRKAAEQPKASTRDAASAKPGTRDAASAKTPTAKPAVKGTYAGTEKARSQNVASAKATTGDRAATAVAKPATGTKSPAAARPKPSTAKAPVDRGYAGKSTNAATKTPSTAAARPTPSASQPTASAARPQASTPTTRPQASQPAPSSSGGGGSAFSGSGSGSSERAASQRGRASTASSGTRASSSGGARTGGRSR